MDNKHNKKLIISLIIFWIMLCVYKCGNPLAPIPFQNNNDTTITSDTSLIVDGTYKAKIYYLGDDTLNLINNDTLSVFYDFTNPITNTYMHRIYNNDTITLKYEYKNFYNTDTISDTTILITDTKFEKVPKFEFKMTHRTIIYNLIDSTKNDTTSYYWVVF